MKSKKAFSFLELVIVIAIVAILASAGVIVYHKLTKQDIIQTEAITNIDIIKDAEYRHKFLEGEFVAADNIDEINKLLDLWIVPRYYEYKVVGVTDKNFIIIATRIGADIDEYLASRRVPPEPIVLVYNRSDREVIDYLGTGNGGGSGGSSGGGSSGSTETGEDEGGFGDGLGSGGGSSSGGSSGGGGSGGGGSGGGGQSPITPPAPTYDSNLTDVLTLLQNSTFGAPYYDLIQRKEISVVTENCGYDALGFWEWPPSNNSEEDCPPPNAIHINPSLLTEMPASAIASIIIHESIHAEYSYYPEDWITRTLERHPELTRDDINIRRTSSGAERQYLIYDPETDAFIQQIIIDNSIDQEYNAFATAVQLWQEIRGDDSDDQMDFWLGAYSQGEEYMKSEIRNLYEEYHLPEY